MESGHSIPPPHAKCRPTQCPDEEAGEENLRNKHYRHQLRASLHLRAPKIAIANRKSVFCCKRPRRQPNRSGDVLFLENPNPPILVFLEKSKGNHQKKARVFLFMEPLKSLEKKGRSHKKSKGNRKTNKKGNKKKGLEGQGSHKKNRNR